MKTFIEAQVHDIIGVWMCTSEIKEDSIFTSHVDALDWDGKDCVILEKEIRQMWEEE